MGILKDFAVNDTISYPCERGDTFCESIYHFDTVIGLHDFNVSVQHKGTDRILPTGHNSVLSLQIAGDLLHALSLRSDNTWYGL